MSRRRRFQCFAASKNGDPVNGGWNFYSREFSDDLGDYPKFGIWPDGLYMSANMFSFGAGSTYQGARALAFNKAQMYAGSPTVKIVSFDVGGGDFTVIPSNARLQTGTPPLGEPNMFVSTSLFLNAVTVYKFHVDWNSIALSTFTGPDTPIAGTELAQRRCQQRAAAGDRNSSRCHTDPGYGAEPVHEPWRDGVFVGAAYSAPRRHDGIRGAALVSVERYGRHSCGDNSPGRDLGS